MLSTVLPTTALTAMSGLDEHLELAKRFHVHTILTYMGTADVNLSQGTHREMNESIVVMRRCNDTPFPPPATRIVSLDRFPRDETETDRLFDALNAADGSGQLADGWGEVSAWPAERIRAGDWSAVAWRSPQLAEAASAFASHSDLAEMCRERDPSQQDRTDAQHRIPPSRAGTVMVHATLQTLYADYRRAGSQQAATS